LETFGQRDALVRRPERSEMTIPVLGIILSGWGVLGGYLWGERKDLGDQSFCLETFGQRDALVRRPERSEVKVTCPKISYRKKSKTSKILNLCGKIRI